MFKTIEAVIDKEGNIQPLEKLNNKSTKRALVTILDDFDDDTVQETAILSEASLAESWNSKEEDDAWGHLQ